MDNIDPETTRKYDICNTYLNALIALADNPTAENKAAADVAGLEWDTLE